MQEATGDTRVIPLMDRYLTYHNANAAERPLDKWAVFRWGDEVVSLIWTYNRTGNARLLELANKLHAQGYDWKAHFADFAFRTKVRKEDSGLPIARGEQRDGAEDVRRLVADFGPALGP